VVLDVDDQVGPAGLHLVERPSRKQPQDLGRDASALGLPSDDVAQLEFAGVPIDLGRQPEPDEPAVAVERREALP